MRTRSLTFFFKIKKSIQNIEIYTTKQGPFTSFQKIYWYVCGAVIVLRYSLSVLSLYMVVHALMIHCLFCNK